MKGNNARVADPKFEGHLKNVSELYIFYSKN